MNTTSQVSGTIRRIFERPAHGVVGLVDDLLKSCRGQSLRLEWQADRCHIRSVNGGPEEVLDQPISKSAFRAILARVAALCNEHRPGSVSPYGGAGELSIETPPPVIFHVVFVNTADEDWLELTAVPA